MPSPAVLPLAREAPPVVLRRVAHGDLAALDALLSSLNAHDRRRRWFTGAADVHAAARWAADPERQRAVGLVATTAGGQIVGHAALIPIDETSGEVCFEVAEAWRHHGIAGLLLAQLDQEAGLRGMTTLLAEVLSENSAMLAVLREHGPCRERRDEGVIEVRLAAAPAVAPAAAPARY